MKISAIIPIYNAEKTIRRLADEIVDALKNYYEQIEIVLVNDGSRDNSHQECIAVFNKYKSITRYVLLSKNFGEHNAVLAGLNYTTGDYVVIIDDDLQNPPSEIKKLVDKAVAGGFDVVYGCYDIKYHSWYRNLASGFNNLVASYLLNKPRDLYLASFKCMNRFTINELIKYKGPFPYIDGLILRATRNIGKVTVRHEKRKMGKSGYNLRKLTGLWVNMFVNFSVHPLRISTFLGFLFSAAGGIMAVSVVIEKIMRPQIPVGITSIIIFVLVFSGIQLIMLGLIGEYIGKQFLTFNQTPQYIVRQMLPTQDRIRMK